MSTTCELSEECGVKNGEGTGCGCGCGCDRLHPLHPSIWVALTFVALQRDCRRGDQMADALQFVRYRGVLAVQFQQYISGGFRMQY